MRLRYIALGCTLTGALGCLALPPAAARAESRAVGKTTLTMTAPAAVVYGADVVVHGRLKFGKAVPPARTTVDVTRTGTGTPKKTFTEHTGSAGRFTLTDRSPAKADYTYTAKFAGDAAEAAATAVVHVTVEKIKPKLTIGAPTTTYSYGAKVKFTVTLGPTFSDRKVSLTASQYGEKPRLVAAGDVDAKGKWHATYAITRKTTFTVSFAGDAHNSPNNARIVLQAHAKVTDQITGYFKRAKIGGITYDVFHGSGTLTLHSTVYPTKHGQCLEPESEQLDGKSWDADTKYGCDRLDTESHDTAPFTLKQAVGDRYRIRGDYIRDSKHLGNLNEHGPWLYFEVVK
ncbi:MAG: hypothetical protein ACRDNW_03650 [Trebonia sp.]